MKEVIKVSKDTDGFLIEYLFKDEMELTEAFYTLLDSLETNEMIQRAMFVALKAIKSDKGIEEMIKVQSDLVS